MTVQATNRPSSAEVQHPADVPATTASTTPQPIPAWLQTVKAYSDALQPPITVLAIVIGGIWTYRLFVQHRQKFPRANISQRVTSWSLSPKDRLLHVAVSVENVGQTLIELAWGFVRVQQVLPLDEAVGSHLACGDDPVQEGECEVLWPQLCERRCDWANAPREVEPGESDEYHFDFVIPESTQVVEVYTHFQNVTKRNRALGWNSTALYTCAQDGNEENTESQNANG